MAPPSTMAELIAAVKALGRIQDIQEKQQAALEALVERVEALERVGSDRKGRGASARRKTLGS